MSFDTIIGQPLAVDLCRQWLKKKTTNPLLFYGPPGVGKKRLALEVAKTLNCQKDACGQCTSCKKIAGGHHPDVRVIDFAWQALERKEPLEKQQNLRIETILTERHRLLQSAAEGSWKVTLIDDAHRLTPDASNVLLKILEEPPANTAIFLITPFRDRLLATILSRCQPIRFRYVEHAPAFSHEEIDLHRQAEALWQSLANESPAQLVRAGEGRGKAAKSSRSEIEQKIHHLMTPAVRALRAGETGAEKPTQLLQNALSQLRQNVQPSLVYDNLLLQLAKAQQ